MSRPAVALILLAMGAFLVLNQMLVNHAAWLVDFQDRVILYQYDVLQEVSKKCRTTQIRSL